MAAVPRRAVLSGSLLRASVRPARCASGRLAVASTLHAAPSILARLPTAAITALGRQAGAKRWYSKPYDEDDESRHGPLSEVKDWEFSDIMEELKKSEDPNRPQNERVVFIDVREPSELQQTGWIPGAINIPITSGVQSFHIHPEEFELMLGYKRPPPDVPVVMYCKAGVRARSAAGLAVHAGFRNVGVYKGSWNDWAARQGPVSHDTTHYEPIPEQPDSHEFPWRDAPSEEQDKAGVDRAALHRKAKQAGSAKSEEDKALAAAERRFEKTLRTVKQKGLGENGSLFDEVEHKSAKRKPSKGQS